MALTTVSIAMHIRCVRCASSNYPDAVIERFSCRSCAVTNELSAERWRDMLDIPANDLPSMKVDTEIWTDIERHNAWIVSKRRDAKCAACKGSLPLEALEVGRAAGQCICPTCGVRIPMRPLPGALARMLPRATHLLGEDLSRVTNAGGYAGARDDGAVALCGVCGGGVRADGSSHAVRCEYCGNMVVLPREVWARLRPDDHEAHVFHLLCDDALPCGDPRGDFVWAGVGDLVGDRDGNVYLIAEDDESHDAPCVVAIDAQLRTRWIRRDLDVSVRGSRIASRGDGTLLLVRENDEAATILRCSDGATIGRIGGAPAKKDVHGLELRGVSRLAGDRDGSIVFVKDHRLVRCGPDGVGIPIWPPRRAFLGWTIVTEPKPFTGEDADGAPYAGEVDDHPDRLRESDLAFGWDGNLYVWNGEDVASFDRTGKRRFRAKLPRWIWAVGADASGVAYVLVNGKDDTTDVFRIGIDGRAALFLDGADAARPIRGKRMLVRPDGALWIFDSGWSLRVIADGGRTFWRNREAMRDDGDLDEDDDD